MRRQDPRPPAGIDRTAFYGSRPYARLREEFEQKLQDVQQAGEQPDPRDAHVTRLKNEITQLRERLAQSAGTITGLTEFRAQALARIAAQHDEIARLRHDLQRAAGHPPAARPGLASGPAGQGADPAHDQLQRACELRHGTAGETQHGPPSQILVVYSRHVG